MHRAVANATKMGLSFGGGDNFAFGVGSNPPAKFLLYDFKIKPVSHEGGKDDDDRDDDKNKK